MFRNALNAHVSPSLLGAGTPSVTVPPSESETRNMSDVFLRTHFPQRILQLPSFMGIPVLHAAENNLCSVLSESRLRGSILHGV